MVAVVVEGDEEGRRGECIFVRGAVRDRTPSQERGERAGGDEEEG